MPEYIDRGALLEDIDAAMENGGVGFVIARTLRRYVKRQPTANVDTVRHGWWKDPAVGVYGCLCSVCKKQSDNCFNYCPNCGAKMDGEPT